MPAPDIQYYLDGALEFGHIAGDTHFFFMNMEPRANEVVDGFDALGPFGEGRVRGLVDSGLYAEKHYVEQRALNRDIREMVSFGAAGSLRYQINALVHLLTDRIRRGRADDWFGEPSIDILHRAMTRVEKDLGGLSRSALLDIKAAGDRHRQALANHARQSLSDLRDELRARGVPAPRGETRKVDRSSRNIIKRSLKIAERVIGPEPTRVFVGGGAMRFEGIKADFELRRSGALTQAHGGATLSVFSKNDTHLCDLCIYTPNVPILDHVASIVLHLRSGNEDEILTVGNAFNISDEARRTDWMMPFLPITVERPHLAIGDIFCDPEFLALPSRDPMLTRRVARLVNRELGDYLPLLTKIRAISTDAPIFRFNAAACR